MFNIFKRKVQKNKDKQLTEIQKFENTNPVHELFNQNGLEIESHHIKHSNRYSRSYYLTQLPNEVSSQDIIKAFDLSEKNIFGEFTYFIKLFIKPVDSLLLYKTIQTTKMNIIDQVKTPIIGGSEIEARNKVDNIEDIEEQVAKGQSLTDVTVCLTIFGDSESHIHQIDKQIQSKLRQKKWIFSIPLFGQKEALLNSMPIPTKNGLPLKALTQPLSLLFLPTSTRLSGLLPIGHDCYRKNVYFFDCFIGDRTHSIGVTGDNGGGKSAFCKKFFEELGLFGVQRWYIDPEGECSKMAKAIGARVVSVNRASGINIIDFNEYAINDFDDEDKLKFNPKADHINWLTDFMLAFPVFDTSLRDNRTPLLNCLSEFYNQEGSIRSNRNMQKLCDFLRNHELTLSIWSKCWEGIKNFSSDEVDNATYGGYFSTIEEFDLNDDMAILDISGNENELVRSALGYALLYKSFEKMLPKDRYRAMFIDELHMFLKFPGFKDLLTQYVKRCRKYNGFFVLLTQELNDYKKYDAIGISKQFGFQVIFSQESISDDVLRVDEQDSIQIRTLPVGTCVIWQKKNSTMDKVKIHLRPYQQLYCAKDNSQDLSLNMFNCY
jgi:hypothetical protein